MSTTPIVQFGTSRFLQAHADLFVSEALEEGAAPGRITVVQTSGDAGRAQRLAALARGFDIHIRGVEAGQAVVTRRHVTSVARGLSLGSDLAEVRRILTDEARILLSNTADAGFRPQPADAGRGYDAAMSFPAKLVHLLRARYEAGGAPLQIMPTELVQDNGTTLRGLVLAAAEGADRGYRDWLAEGVTWVNSLVDRIVSAPMDPAGAVAEPYALWAVEACPGLIAPCHHPAVQIVDDLGPIARRKLFILNLGHSWMVSEWLARGRRGPQLVREVMEDPDSAARLRGMLADEVLPGFAAAGEGEGVEAYIGVTLDRFANPFLDHRLEDIAQNHSEKLRRRIGAFLDWAQENGDRAAKPMLAAAVQGESA